jgi:hypothetical protein
VVGGQVRRTEVDLRGLPPRRSAAAAIGALCVLRPVCSCARALPRWLTDVSAPLCEASRATGVGGGGHNRPAWRAATRALALICANCARSAAVLPPPPPCAAASPASFRRARTRSVRSGEKRARAALAVLLAALPVLVCAAEACAADGVPGGAGSSGEVTSRVPCVRRPLYAAGA